MFNVFLFVLYFITLLFVVFTVSFYTITPNVIFAARINIILNKEEA